MRVVTSTIFMWSHPAPKIGSYPDTVHASRLLVALTIRDLAIFGKSVEQIVIQFFAYHLLQYAELPRQGKLITFAILTDAMINHPMD